jgi:stage V sporulation protein B
MGRFMGGLALYLLILNLLMFVDGWLLKRLVAEAAERGGLSDPARIASEQAAIYSGAVQTFARIPYQVILSVTFVIFPLVSRSSFEADRAATQRYIERAVRYSFLVVGAMATAMAARPDALMALFGRKYLAGASALPALAFGYVAFSIFSIAGTIVNGAGRTAPTVVIGAITLAVDVAANFVAVRGAGATGHDPLSAAAMATAGAMGLGLILSLGYLERAFGASLPAFTPGRTALAAAAGIAVGRLAPVHGKLGLAACVAGGLTFLATLFATRELTAAELRALRRR